MTQPTACHATDRTDEIHLTEQPRDSAVQVTLCGWQIKSRLPYVPIEDWGAPDQAWCRRCGTLARRSLGHGNSKTSPEDRAEIIRRREAGESCVSIAADYELNPSSVSNICCGHWRAQGGMK